MKMQGPSTGYATLSYYWGKDPPFNTLTIDNLNEFCLSLPEQDFPPVFLKAMTVTRSLGLNFIWIDALCIIQPGKESVEDWHVHSAKMDRIYAKYQVNIAHLEHPIQKNDFLGQERIGSKKASTCFTFTI